jgi:anti-sigma factor RsiW
MCCSDKQEQITSFLDGNLSTRDQIELFKHLAVCNDCQSFIDVMMRMRDIQKHERINYPIEIDEALLTRIGRLRYTPDTEVPHARQITHHLIPRRITLPLPLAIGVAAAAIIIGFLLNGVFFRGPSTSAIPINYQSQSAQPTAVIFFYGMPPLEVTGPSLMPARHDIKEQNY